MYSSLHCMQKDYSTYLTNALSCDVVLTADLIYCKFPSIVKKNTITDSVTTALIIPFMQKRFIHRKGCELQIQLLAVLAVL